MRWVLLAAFIIILLVVVIPIGAQNLDIFSSLRDYQVDPRFLEYYQSHGGNEIFGEPITRSVLEEETGELFQYFENGRLESVEDQNGHLTIKISALGVLLGGWETPLTGTSADRGCELFEETGHQVCHAFLEYYRMNGGPEIIGYPISEIKVVGGQTVQYFQRFRLDWDRESGSQGEVRPGPLGRMYWESLSSAGEATSTPVSNTVEIVPSMSLKFGVMQPSGEQTVFLHVIDQTGDPVVGASATLQVSSGEIARTFIFPLTDNNGLTQVRIPFENVPSGTTIQLTASVIYTDQTVETRDSFLIYGADS